MDEKNKGRELTYRENYAYLLSLLDKIEKTNDTGLDVKTKAVTKQFFFEEIAKTATYQAFLLQKQLQLINNISTKGK